MLKQKSLNIDSDSTLVNSRKKKDGKKHRLRRKTKPPSFPGKNLHFCRMRCTLISLNKRLFPIMKDDIIIKGAEEHNLKKIDVRIPRNTLTVITGLSGSGKSSLAFDTLYAEGQRRYVDPRSSTSRDSLRRLRSNSAPRDRIRVPPSPPSLKSTTICASSMHMLACLTVRSAAGNFPLSPRRRSANG